MKVLELFSGTHSVGKVCKEKGYEVISLDLKDADINSDILLWDYTVYPTGYFDIIWASPPCNSFSILQNCRRTKAEIIENIKTTGLPILTRTLELIDYFKPTLYFIENPQTGKMKEYITDKPFFDVDYCRYSNWGYRKRTRIWTNKTGFIPKLCDKKCGNMILLNGSLIHKNDCGGSKNIRKINATDIAVKIKCTTLNERYRIPLPLIKDLLS